MRGGSGAAARGALLLGLLLMAAQRCAAARWDRQQQDLPLSCRSEWQLVMCRDIPPEATAQIAACCLENRAARRPPPAAAARAKGVLDAPRRDLEQHAGALGPPLHWRFGECTRQRVAEVPAFSRGADGVTNVKITQQPAPWLPSEAVAGVKAAALRAASEAAAAGARAMQDKANATRDEAGRRSGFIHPGSFAGAPELALLRARLAAGSPLQGIARESLLTGKGVPPKYTSGGWYPPVNTPADGYGGPYPMERFLADWGGWAKERNTTCPRNFPKTAPLEQCGHYAFVEIDAAMAYKNALAYVATGDERYAAQAMDAVQAWARTNKVFGLSDRNGPLEAAWGCSAMARAMDVLKATWPGFQRGHLDTFMNWVARVIMPQMDYYIDQLNPGLLQGPERARKTLAYGNWPATMADAMMAVGVLSDDRWRYEKGLALYKAVVDAYFKWGRGQYAKGRIIGESTETLRDVYHTEFGLGSLIQAAETAWGQNDDVYGENKYVLAAALELHARIINAWEAKDEAALPPGFKFFESMPKAPEGCAWSWDIYTQKWSSYTKTGDRKLCSELNDGYKYLLGITYLPTGFEIGYNHFAGRLGLPLPETAKLLKKHPVDWQAFCWGLGTLTHADSARDLWRAGVSRATLCAARRRARGAARRGGGEPEQQQQQQQQEQERGGQGLDEAGEQQQERQQEQQRQEQGVVAASPPPAEAPAGMQVGGERQQQQEQAAAEPRAAPAAAPPTEQQRLPAVAVAAVAAPAVANANKPEAS